MSFNARVASEVEDSPETKVMFTTDINRTGEHKHPTNHVIHHGSDKTLSSYSSSFRPGPVASRTTRESWLEIILQFHIGHSSTAQMRDKYGAVNQRRAEPLAGSALAVHSLPVVPSNRR